MLTVHKFPLAMRDIVLLNMPEKCLITKVEAQGDEVMIWAIVNTEAPMAWRSFRIFETGAKLDPKLADESWDPIIEKAPFGVTLDFIATVQLPPYVYHVFERVPNTDVSFGEFLKVFEKITPAPAS
jgi:hypothetical protein